jgi:hypothetical protein
MRLGVAHHFGWAVAVTASAHQVVDRRRIDLVEPGVPMAPIHHDSDHLDDAEAAALVALVRASAQRATSASLDALETDLSEPIVSMSLRGWQADFPDDIGSLRCSPYEARADSVMYREVLRDCALERGWEICFFDAKGVEREAASMLGDDADRVLRHGPRATLGPPWSKDHRIAFAATIVAG